MDKWEREHIQKNLSSLVRLTMCNTQLMAELTLFLSKDDEDQLNAKLLAGNMAQSKLFYDIAITKHGMYEALTKVLLETKQTGAFQILLQGAMLHRPNFAIGVSAIHPEVLQQALKGFGKHTVSCLVNFQGTELRLEELLHEIPSHEADFLIENYLRGDFLFKLIDNRQPTLFNNSVPSDIDYYVPRRLTPRHRINPAIFIQNCADIFIVKNIQLHELSRLSGNEGADVSTSQTECLTRRFIVLIYEQDYDQICKLASVPVHLLEFSSEHFTWIKSQGSLAMMQCYINVEQTDLTEEEFLQVCLDCSNPICITDTPGMGKTVLLASFANKIMRLHPTRHVRYIVLREFVPLFHGLSPEKIDAQFLIQNIYEQSSEFEFGKEIMKKLLNCEHKTVEILFDGFDEVLASQVETAKHILHLVSTIKSVRVYVTTRPHMRDELEKTIGVLGYNIKPFGIHEQVECLTKFWLKEEATSNEDILQEFASDCIVALEKNMNDSEREIAGIPLQCKMLAEVYQEDAIKYSKNNKVSTFEAGMVIKITSIFDMYRKLISLRFQRISKSDEGQENKLKSVTFAHMLAAVELLFPECDDGLKCILNDGYEDVEHRELCGIGILEKKISTTTPRFIHRTFAEYFLGLFAVRMLHYHEDFGWQFFTRNTFLKFLYDTVFLTTMSSVSVIDSYGVGKCDHISSSHFNYSVICYFINAHLKTLEKEDHICKSLWTNDVSKLYDVVAAAITHDFPAVFYQLSEEPIVYPNLILDNKQVFCLTMLSAKYSSLELFKMMHQHLHDCIGDIQPQYLLANFPEFAISPLHIAVERGHYGITDFIIQDLLKNGTLFNARYIVHCCVGGSKRDKPATVDFKKQIIKLLVDNCSNWIDEAMPDGTTPLLMFNAHLELLQTLLDCGADVNALSSNGCILHRLTDNELTPKRFYELNISLLKYDFKNFNCVGTRTQSPLHIAVQKIELLEESINLFQWMKADFNAVDDNGDSVFFYAVRAKRSLNMLQKLIECGCNWTTENSNHENVFHIAANHGYFEAFELFLQRDDFELRALNSVSKSGLTPFLQAMQLGKALPLSLIKTMEDKGFVISKELASKGLRALLCNKFIMAWELDENFTNVTRHLLQKGGVLACRNGTSPWHLEATQKNMHNIAAIVKCDLALCMDLRTMGVRDLDTPETVTNKNDLHQCHPKLLADLRSIGHKSIDSMDLPLDEPFESLHQKLITQENSFERLCVSLIKCKQIQAFGLLKQCLQSDLQESIKFVTPVNGLLPFIHSKYNQVVILRSQNGDLSTTRLRNTIDPDIPVILLEDLSREIQDTNLFIYRCELADSNVIQAITKLETKVVCVCSNVKEGLDNCLILSDDITWDDLSANFQEKLNLWAGVRSEIYETSFADPENLKNEQLVSFIVEQEQSSLELPHMLHEFAKNYTSQELLDWFPETSQIEITPLHIAAKLGYTATTEFFLSARSLADLQKLKYIAHFCVRESSSDNSDTVSKKEKILRLLSKIHKFWIDEPLYPSDVPPLLQSKVNEKLLDSLVKCGADMKIALEYGKGLTMGLIKILEENDLQLTKDLASETFTNIICSKRIMGWELNSDLVQVADYLIKRGAQLICQNETSPWELEAVKANTKRIADALLCNHALLVQLEIRGFNDLGHLTESSLLFNTLKTLGHKKSFEYLCTCLIACNQIKPYILLKLCLQSHKNQAAKFITPPIGISDLFEKKACNVAVLKTWSVELSIARLKETVDKDLVVLSETEINRELSLLKEYNTNILVLECGTATVQTLQSLASIERKIICVCIEISPYVQESEACKVLSDDMSWEDLSTYYKKNLNLSVAARFEMHDISHKDYQVLTNGALVRFLVDSESSNVAKNIDNYKSKYLEPIPTFFSSMVPKFSPTPLHIAVERGHADITEYLLTSNLYSDTEDLKYVVHCCVAVSIADNDAVIINKLKLIELLSKKNYQLLDERLPDGCTPLLQSSVHSKLVECLINQGADINAQTKNEETFLMKALSSGHSLNLNILKLMEKKGLIISQQQADEGLSALFSSKNRKHFGLSQDFVEILDYLTEKSSALAVPNSIWESELMKHSLIKIEKATQSSGNLLEELKARGIITGLQMEELLDNSELLFKILRASEHHNSFAATCASLVACHQIEPFLLLKQCFRLDVTDRIMFAAPHQELADFVLKSKYECVVVLRSWDFELTVERIKDTIDTAVLLVNDKSLNEELPTTPILIYNCDMATVEGVKRLASFQRKVIYLCKNVDDEVEGVKLYEDKFTWKDLSEELKYDLLTCICDDDIETVGKYSELQDKELVDFIRQNLPQFTGIEKEETSGEDKYLSEDIFHYFHAEKFAFLGISRDELNKYIKFDHKIGGSKDDIDELDFVLIENEQNFEEICKQTSSNFHLIDHDEGRFKHVKTKGEDENLMEFIKKNPLKTKCENIPVCTCGDHGIGSANLIWNVFRSPGKDRTYWINILNVLQEMKIGGFKLGNSSAITEVTKLFSTAFFGLNDLECYRKMKMAIGGTFLRSNSIPTANVIEELLRYIGCEEGERNQLMYIAVKMLFPKLVLNAEVNDLKKYFEIGMLKYNDNSPVFVDNFLAWYFVAELIVNNESWFVNIAELREAILCDNFKSADVKIAYVINGLLGMDWNIESFKSFRFVNSTFFNFLDSILSLHYEVISSVLRELSDKAEDFWLKWLHACVVGNHFNLLKLGINSSISMKPTLSELNNLLCFAVKLADIPVIDLLIEQFPLNYKKMFGFEFSIHKKDFEISILHIAAVRGNYSVINHLIKNKRFRQNLKTPYMTNIIAYCVYNTARNPSQVEERKLIIRILLEHRSTLINGKNKNKFWIPPLLVQNTHFELVKLLINLGANVNEVNKYSENILHSHAKHMSPEDYHKLAETLFARGVLELFNAKDKYLSTPLHVAVRYMELLDSTIKLFSEAKADFNTVDKLGDTLLILAVKCNRSLRVLQALINYGADFRKRSRSGQSVLHRAAYFSNLSALRYFIARGCEVNAKDDNDNTPLHHALRLYFSNLYETVKILIEHGADVNAKNKKGETPISLANNLRLEPRIVELLKDAASQKPK